MNSDEYNDLSVDSNLGYFDSSEEFDDRLYFQEDEIENKIKKSPDQRDTNPQQHANLCGVMPQQ